MMTGYSKIMKKMLCIETLKALPQEFQREHTKPQNRKNVATEKQSYGYNFSLEELDKSENLFQRGQPVPHEDQQGRSYEYQRERNES